MAIILFFMQASKKVPWEDPNVLNGIRGLYILSNVIIVGIYIYVGMKIDKKKGRYPTPRTDVFAVECMIARSEHRADLNSAPDMTVLKYVEPAPMGSQEEPKSITTTVHAYDKQQLRALYKSQLMGVGMMAVMHLYMKYTNPLLIQSIIPLKGAFEGNLVKVHLLGKPATGDLRRPWKAAGIMGMGASEIKTDRKSIEEAERKGRGGAKEE